MVAHLVKNRKIIPIVSIQVKQQPLKVASLSPAFEPDLITPTFLEASIQKIKFNVLSPQYGLSFVHIDEAEGSSTSAVPPRLLAFDTFSSDEEEFKPGELFAKHLQKTGTVGSPANTTNNTGKARQCEWISKTTALFEKAERYYVLYLSPPIDYYLIHF